MSSNACPLPAALQAEPAYLGWWFSLQIMPRTIPTTTNCFITMQQFSNMVPKTHYSNQQSAPITLHISIYYKSYTEEIMTVLRHTGDDKRVTRLLYATLNSLMMGY